MNIDYHLGTSCFFRVSFFCFEIRPNLNIINLCVGFELSPSVGLDEYGSDVYEPKNI